MSGTYRNSWISYNCLTIYNQQPAFFFPVLFFPVKLIRGDMIFEVEWSGIAEQVFHFLAIWGFFKFQFPYQVIRAIIFICKVLLSIKLLHIPFTKVTNIGEQVQVGNINIPVESSGACGLVINDLKDGRYVWASWLTISEVESSQRHQMRMTMEGLTKDRMLNHRTQ